MQGIYCIENIATKRKYYGSSMDVCKRLQQHQTDLLKGRPFIYKEVSTKTRRALFIT